jgi:hypothetical protein
MVAPTASAAAIHADTTTQLVSALLESQKQHTELARMYVSQFPVLVNALSGVVRSAGDAGLPARVPLVVPVAPEAKPVEQASSAKDSDEDDDDEEEDDDEEDDEAEEVEGAEAAPESGWNWPRVAGSALEKFGPQLESLVGGIPALAATLGGAMRIKRGAAKATEPASGAPAPAADIGAHLIAIRAALTAEEGAMVMALANELSMADKLTYFEKLRGMSVPEAVAYVRAELVGLARNSAHGAAGPEVGGEPGLAMFGERVRCARRCHLRRHETRGEQDGAVDVRRAGLRAPAHLGQEAVQDVGAGGGDVLPQATGRGRRQRTCA